MFLTSSILNRLVNQINITKQSEDPDVHDIANAEYTGKPDVADIKYSNIQ